jgi:Tfp pilus assembly protein PilF
LKIALPLCLAALIGGSGALAATPVPSPDVSRPHAHRQPKHNVVSSESKEQMLARMNRVADELAKRVDHYWHEGDFESVAFVEARVVELDPSDVDTWANLAWIYWSCLNNEPKAERTLRDGLAANPRRYELYDELGNYLYRRKRYGEAAATLTKAVSFKNAHQLTWNSYAHALERLGKTQRAAEVWRTMETKFPGNPHSTVNLARMKRKGLLPTDSPQ